MVFLYLSIFENIQVIFKIKVKCYLFRLDLSANFGKISLAALQVSKNQNEANEKKSWRKFEASQVLKTKTIPENQKLSFRQN